MKISKANLKRISRGELPVPSEEDVQRVIIDGLRILGFIVFVTSRRVKKCRKCGTYSHHGDGAGKGLADLIVRRSMWQPGVCIALEVKKTGPIRYSSKEQRLAAEYGDVVVVRSIDDALHAINIAEETLKAFCRSR